MSESGITVTLTANEHEAIQLAARGAHKLGLMFSIGGCNEFRRVELEDLTEVSEELRALKDRILLEMTREEFDAIPEHERRLRAIKVEYGSA